MTTKKIEHGESEAALLGMVDLVFEAGETLRDARIAEIDVVYEMEKAKNEIFADGAEGKNEKQREANVRVRLETIGHTKIVSEAKKARIVAETDYKAAKRSLRVMELIYKVQNDGQ